MNANGGGIFSFRKGEGGGDQKLEMKGGFLRPVCPIDTELESSVNRQAGKPALQDKFNRRPGRWRAGSAEHEF